MNDARPHQTVGLIAKLPQAPWIPLDTSARAEPTLTSNPVPLMTTCPPSRAQAQQTLLSAIAAHTARHPLPPAPVRPLVSVTPEAPTLEHSARTLTRPPLTREPASQTAQEVAQTPASAPVDTVSVLSARMPRQETLTSARKGTHPGPGTIQDRGRGLQPHGKAVLARVRAPTPLRASETAEFGGQIHAPSRQSLVVPMEPSAGVSTGQHVSL